MTAAYRENLSTQGAQKVSDARAAYWVKGNSVQTVGAIYDGKVLLPNSPLLLKPITRVRITIETIKPKRGKQKSFLETARSIKIETPSDFSENLDDL